MDLVSKYSILTLLNIILKESQTQGKLMEAILTAISRILDTAKHFQQDDPFHPLFNFQSEGGTDILEELQHSPNVQIFTLASNIIKTHYSTEDEGEVFSEPN
mmetsp:Transcript_12859/g.12849  ORF Transcript_12859/g.12849 Transcript_12859/m.12849 type:complete len:102 (+) Transcript_12859:836-1141(+)